jgi:hypothetical protein
VKEEIKIMLEDLFMWLVSLLSLAVVFIIAGGIAWIGEQFVNWLNEREGRGSR